MLSLLVLFLFRFQTHIALGRLLVALLDHFLPVALFQITLVPPLKAHPARIHSIFLLQRFLLYFVPFPLLDSSYFGTPCDSPESSSVSSSFSVTSSSSLEDSSGSDPYSSLAPVFSACPVNFFSFPSHLALERLLVALLDYLLVVSC